MTGTVSLEGAFRRFSQVPASERRILQWAVQALVPWALTVAHPSIWGLASASAQLVGGSLLLLPGARLRLAARGSALLIVLGHGVDPANLVGATTQVLIGGLEAALLVAVVSVLRRQGALAQSVARSSQ